MILINHNPPFQHAFYKSATKANVAAPNKAKLTPIAAVPVFGLAGVTEDVAEGDFITPVVVEL